MIIALSIYLYIVTHHEELPPIPITGMNVHIFKQSSLDEFMSFC